MATGTFSKSGLVMSSFTEVTTDSNGIATTSRGTDDMEIISGRAPGSAGVLVIPFATTNDKWAFKLLNASGMTAYANKSIGVDYLFVRV